MTPKWRRRIHSVLDQAIFLLAAATVSGSLWLLIDWMIG